MLVTWLAVYPTITALVVVFAPLLLGRVPLPVFTLVVTALGVPISSYVLVPWLQRAFAGWLRGR